MTNPLRFFLLSLLGLVVLCFLGLHVGAWWLTRSIDLPTYERVEVRELEQNWTADDRQWFYHTSQGSSFELLLPYEWFTALEQPRLPPLLFGEVPRVVEEEYIARFGFLPNSERGYDPENLSYTDHIVGEEHSAYREDALNNEDRLPVGFVRTREYRHPLTGETLDVVGFTCAACHTGQLNYRGQGIRIEGGPALTDLGKFRTGVGLALLFTRYIPTRFDRFAQAVLGEDHTDVERVRLKGDLETLIAQGRELRERLEQGSIYPTEEGFARLDALGRIGNFVFGTELDWNNLAVANAPVNYPHIWGTPWFDWVQYNSSIMQPMTRNAGEALGVFARVDLKNVEDPSRLFRSTIDVQSLYEMESLIRGDKPWTGLASPKWPEDVLGGIDRQKAAVGKRLYRDRCQACHLPPTSSGAFFDDAYWTPEDEYGNRYLKVRTIPLQHLGTDPLQTQNFLERTVKMGALGDMDFGELGRRWNVSREMSAAGALGFLIEASVRKRYQDLGIPESLWPQYDGLRPNKLQGEMVYKARPLDGIWATPPYLHNGSVPNLYQMLLPATERDATFHLGTKEFDPVHVGYALGPISGGFELDTSVPGNSNAGHEFRGSDDPSSNDYWRNLGQGVLGPAFSETQRWALVEYLKTI